MSSTILQETQRIRNELDALEAYADANSVDNAIITDIETLKSLLALLEPFVADLVEVFNEENDEQASILAHQALNNHDESTGAEGRTALTTIADNLETTLITDFNDAVENVIPGFLNTLSRLGNDSTYTINHAAIEAYDETQLDIPTASLITNVSAGNITGQISSDISLIENLKDSFTEHERIINNIQTATSVYDAGNYNSAALQFRAIHDDIDTVLFNISGTPLRVETQGYTRDAVQTSKEEIMNDISLVAYRMNQMHRYQVNKTTADQQLTSCLELIATQEVLDQLVTTINSYDDVIMSSDLDKFTIMEAHNDLLQDSYDSLLQLRTTLIMYNTGLNTSVSLDEFVIPTPPSSPLPTIGNYLDDEDKSVISNGFVSSTVKSDVSTIINNLNTITARAKTLLSSIRTAMRIIIDSEEGTSLAVNRLKSVLIDFELVLAQQAYRRVLEPNDVISGHILKNLNHYKISGDDVVVYISNLSPGVYETKSNAGDADATITFDGSTISVPADTFLPHVIVKIDSLTLTISARTTTSITDYKLAEDIAERLSERQKYLVNRIVYGDGVF